LLDVVNLSCTRGDRLLFSGVSFTVGAGELLHITGRNGSGKTTLLRTLCGLTQAADGHVRWQGVDARTLGDEYRAKLAYVGHLNGIRGELTALENLNAVAALAGDVRTARAESALEKVALDAYRAFPAKILSQGQKRRLALARLLVLERPLWILDEPLTALDTRSIEIVTQQLAAQLNRGGAVIITSHQPLDALPSRKTLSLDS
jgi:heme exporter protein A